MQQVVESCRIYLQTCSSHFLSARLLRQRVIIRRRHNYVQVSFAALSKLDGKIVHLHVTENPVVL